MKFNFVQVWLNFALKVTMLYAFNTQYYHITRF